MKYFYCCAILFCLFLIPQKSFCQERPFGLGIIIGNPTGITAKLWTSNETAFDFAVAWSSGGNLGNRHYDTHLHADYLWHSFGTIVSEERFPLYYGLGGRLNFSGGDNSFAARGIFGIAWMPRKTPIDVFIEIVPEVELTPSSEFLVGAAIGARYYF